ncbi:MAG: hypothetical protein A2W19_08740 [Spirochaetes bacterium RBG_16_49_21]|nr:MAG: hypothetical protein A2W19_08740 [Spirochaetes bacterium RBG_16_49_21]
MNIFKNHKAYGTIIHTIILPLIISALSCNGEGIDIKEKIGLILAFSRSPAPVSVSCSGNCLISWNANREKAVNSSGGGYRLYYSKNSHFQISDADVQMIDVPYVSGSTAPTSKSVNFGEGNWYIRIVAYSSLNGESVSAPSD